MDDFDPWGFDTLGLNQGGDDDEPAAVSVSELTSSVKSMLEGNFPQLWVSGEISDLSRPRSGHLYFTLKDAHSQIRGVIWRSTAMRLEQQLGGVPLRDGDSVLCFGGVEVYAPRGTYQIVVKKVQPQGVGELQQKFQRLQAKLDAEGLFSAERKVPIPTIPRRIAVITSPSGAAIRDFLEAAAARWIGVEIVVIPALVQGPRAASSIAEAINSADRLRPRVDTLVLTRGGGSLEDLWCFNEEIVVRAIAAISIPVVSGVGHEIDVTLCDLVADLRALTPTDAAAKVLPDTRRIQQTVVELRRRLDSTMRSRLDAAQSAVAGMADRTVFTRPHDLIRNRYRELDDLERIATRAIRNRLEKSNAQIRQSAASLQALSPLQVLSRGYSVTVNADGQAIRHSHEVAPGDRITTRLSEGQIQSVVSENAGLDNDPLK